MEFTGHIRNNDIDFGDYVQYPYGYSKELHIYKVVGAVASNSYRDMPDVPAREQIHHKDIVPCLNIIHCGIDETKVIRVRQEDCIKADFTMRGIL